MTAPVAACVAVAEWTAPAGAPVGPGGERVPVSSALSVCPYAESEGTAVLTSRLSAAVPSGAEAAEGAGEGTAAVARLGQPDAELAAIAVPGQMTFTDLGSPAEDQLSSFVAVASGPTAPGFTLSSTTLVNTSQQRGLAGLTCPSPGTEFWFVGSALDVEHAPLLTLVNAESAPAQWDVEVYGVDGLLSTPGLRQRTLAPGEVSQTLLTTAVEVDPAEINSTIAVHVVVRVGRLVAGLGDERKTEDVLKGTDWLQPVERPLTSGVIPGIPAGGGERTLYLFAPGTEGALVNIQFAGVNGLFSPISSATELATVSVSGGSAVTLPLAEAARGEEFSVIIEADRPVVAALRVGTDSETPDYGYVAMTAELGGPSVIADAREGGGFVSSVLLTAPETDATVSLAALRPEAAPMALEPVQIRAGTTVTYPIPEIGSAGYAIVVTPAEGSGPVYGSRLLTQGDDGGFLTIEALTPTRTTALVPAVESDLSAGLRSAE